MHKEGDNCYISSSTDRSEVSQTNVDSGGHVWDFPTENSSWWPSGERRVQQAMNLTQTKPVQGHLHQSPSHFSLVLSGSTDGVLPDSCLRLRASLAQGLVTTLEWEGINNNLIM